MNKKRANFYISLLFLILYLGAFNYVLNFYYLNRNDLYNYIINILKNNKKISKTECVNRNNYSYNCVDVDSFLNNTSFKTIDVIVKNRIRHGLKSIRKNDKIITVKPFNKTLHESYKIYYMKKIYINQYGSIITSSNQHISIKGGCRCKNELNNYIDIYENKKHYQLVFQITQYLGSSIYHSIINCLTKIVPLMNTLKYLHNSKIHIHNNTAIINYLHLLDIGSERFVYGNLFSDNIFIMDRVECTSSIYTRSVIELRDLLIKNIKRKYYFKYKNEKNILFIKRLYTRRINNFEEILSSICKKYTSYKCKIYSPNTKFSNMVELFYNADIIFGPHGAGFTNIVVSKNELMVYEIIKENHPVLCFATLSNILGYKYYGIYSKCNANEEFNLNITLILKSFNEQFLI